MSLVLFYILDPARIRHIKPSQEHEVNAMMVNITSVNIGLHQTLFLESARDYGAKSDSSLMGDVLHRLQTFPPTLLLKNIGSF